MRMRLAAVVLAAALAAGCGRGGAGAAQTGQAAEKERQDSIHDEQKALIDSGVTVDTQVVDTGATKATPAEDN